MELTDVQKKLITEVSDLNSVPKGAYNFRVNGQVVARNVTANVYIKSKNDSVKKGIDIYVKDNTKNESLYIPVIISNAGYSEEVYNDFYIVKNCNISIIAGCGIDNCENIDSIHNGIHRFFVGENSSVNYVEKHYGSGSGYGKKILNPKTEIYAKNNAFVKMETIQISGVDNTIKTTEAVLQEKAKLIVYEKIQTDRHQKAKSKYRVLLQGEESVVDIVSRSVAKGKSHQKFEARVLGNSMCKGHIECDSIIMDEGKILAVPSLEANSSEAVLIHEAAIGKIAKDQLEKLMTLGVTEKDAEEFIIKGFLK